MCSAYRLIFMQSKLIFTWKVLDERLLLKQRHKLNGKWPIQVPFRPQVEEEVESLTPRPNRYKPTGLLPAS